MGRVRYAMGLGRGHREQKGEYSEGIGGWRDESAGRKRSKHSKERKRRGR